MQRLGKASQILFRDTKSGVGNATASTAACGLFPTPHAARQPCGRCEPASAMWALGLSTGHAQPASCLRAMHGPGIFSSVHAELLPVGTALTWSLIYPDWSLNLTASQAWGRGADKQGHLQVESSIECNVVGGSTISWKDAVTFAGSVFSGTVAFWAEDMMKAQIKAFETNGLMVRSGHGPCALLKCCAARRLPAFFGNDSRTCRKSRPYK